MYCPTGTVPQVLSYRYCHTGTIIQLLSYMYCPASSPCHIYHILKLSFTEPKKSTSVKWKEGNQWLPWNYLKQKINIRKLMICSEKDVFCFRFIYYVSGVVRQIDLTQFPYVNSTAKGDKRKLLQLLADRVCSFLNTILSVFYYFEKVFHSILKCCFVLAFSKKVFTFNSASQKE